MEQRTDSKINKDATKKISKAVRMAARTSRLIKFVVHTGSDRHTVLPIGAVECVFGDGSGLNFFSVDALKEFCAAQPSSEDVAVKRSILLAAQEVDPTFVNIDAVKNVDLSVDSVARPVVITP